MSLTEGTKRRIIDSVIRRGNIQGKLELKEFLDRIWGDAIKKLPAPNDNDRCNNLLEAIDQHMIRNHDWDDSRLYYTHLELHKDDGIFKKFIKNYLHQIVRPKNEMKEMHETINKHLKDDGYILEEDNNDSYDIVSSLGVQNKIVQLIFGSTCKPDILIDTLTNHIEIVNASGCLTYEEKIEGILTWNVLVEWWKQQCKPTITQDKTVEQQFQKKLISSLKEDIEKIFFSKYYEIFEHENLPALIPQVWFHYTPSTIPELKKRSGKVSLPPCRIDFLMILSQEVRVIFELDGQTHYTDNMLKPSPIKYAEMVIEDRKLRLEGYEVYRFGGYEFQEKESPEIMIKDFFMKLFYRHKVEYKIQSSKN